MPCIRYRRAWLLICTGMFRCGVGIFLSPQPCHRAGSLHRREAKTFLISCSGLGFSMATCPVRERPIPALPGALAISYDSSTAGRTPPLQREDCGDGGMKMSCFSACLKLHETRRMSRYQRRPNQILGSRAPPGTEWATKVDTLFLVRPTTKIAHAEACSCSDDNTAVRI